MFVVCVWVWFGFGLLFKVLCLGCLFRLGLCVCLGCLLTVLIFTYGLTSCFVGLVRDLRGLLCLRWIVCLVGIECGVLCYCLLCLLGCFRCFGCI